MRKTTAAYTSVIAVLVAILVISVLPGDYIFGQGKALPVGKEEEKVVEQKEEQKEEQKADNNDLEVNEYKILLQKYQANIAGITETRNNSNRERIKADLETIKKQHDELRNAETRTLDSLRLACKIRDSKKIDFVGEGLEYRVLIPSSVESARIFSTLVKDELVDRKAMLTVLYARLTIDDMSKEWLGCLREMQLSPDKAVKDLATLCIYKAGLDDAGMYRYIDDILDDEIITINNTLLFDLLYSKVLFAINKNTFTREPVITDKNTALVALLSDKCPSHRIRVLCAEYEIANKNIEKGVNDVEKVMWIMYILRGDGDGEDPVNAKDIDLYHARRYALSLLFYDVCTEKSFELVYNRAVIARIERDKPDTLPEGFRIFSRSSILATWEIEHAKTLLKGVSVNNDNK